MAKETKKERSSGGKKGFRTRVKNAKAAHKKSIKVGKHRIPLSEFDAAGNRKKGEAKAERKRPRKPKAEAAPRKSPKKGGHRKGHGKRAKPRTKHVHHTKVVTKRRTVEVRVPGKTRKVFVTAAERRGGHRHHRRAREGYAMENPLSTMEIVAGGLTMLLGLAVADVSDRYWATHALTPSTTTTGTTTTTTYTDTPVGTAGTAPTTSFGTGLYPGMLNGASVMAPMNLTRWVSGGVLATVPFVAAAFIKEPTMRTAVQLFGFGVIARIGGKALVDLFAGLLGSTSLGQQLYVNELAATAQYQVAMGQTTTITLPSPGTNPPAAGGPSGSASGLAKPPQPSSCCSGCAVGGPCVRSQHAPQQRPQPAQPTNTTQVPTNGGTISQVAPPVNPATPVAIQGNTVAVPDASTTGLSAPRRALPPVRSQKINPYAWSEHIYAGPTRH